MSITSLTTPPEKNSRRVRFSLPEAKLTLHSDKKALHGTTKYVNGTLINVALSIHSPNDLLKSSSKSDFKSSLKSYGGGNQTKESLQCKALLNTRHMSATTNKDYGRNSLPATTACIDNRKKCYRTVTTTGIKNFSKPLPIIERKSSSLEDFKGDSLEEDYGEEMEHSSRVKPSTNLARYKSTDDLSDASNYKLKNTVLKLPEDLNGAFNLARKKSSTSNILRVPDYSDTISKLFIFSINKRTL